jgi:hypothetical protein
MKPAFNDVTCPKALCGNNDVTWLGNACLFGRRW